MSEQILKEVLALLDEVLSLDGRALGFSADTPLLGDLPELDSMAVIGLIAALEDHFGIFVADDDIHARHFATVGTLHDFVSAQLRP